MKRVLFILVLVVTFSSCKAVLKGAAKYWTKQQIKEFVANCEEHAGKLMSAEKAEFYCDCAVDKVSEKYNNYEDVKKAGIVEVLKLAKECKQ